MQKKICYLLLLLLLASVVGVNTSAFNFTSENNDLIDEIEDAPDPDSIDLDLESDNDDTAINLNVGAYFTRNLGQINDENVIFVGNKPPMNYVTAVITQFNLSGSSEVILKARGSAISRAVDAAEIVRNRFMTDLKLKSIEIGTESVTNEEGRKSNVSSIEITLAKPKK